MLFIILLILALLLLPWPWNLAVIALAAVLEVSLWIFGIRYSRRRRAQVGVQMMIGMHGEALTALAPTGQVKVDGEIWEAHAAGGARMGDEVLVTSIDGLTLEVEKAQPAL
jgi:membrane-bound serine protease (ClpP class)